MSLGAQEAAGRAARPQSPPARRAMAAPPPETEAFLLWLRAACRAARRGRELPAVPHEIRARFRSPGELFRAAGSTPASRGHFAEIAGDRYEHALLASLELMCAGLQVPRHRLVDLLAAGPGVRADATPLGERAELSRGIRDELRRAKASAHVDEEYVDALEVILEVACELQSRASEGVNAGLRLATGTDYDFAAPTLGR